MIELDNVTYRYHGSVIPAVDAVSARIEPGIHLLLGENGAGKTTLIRIIGSQLLATSGKCLLDGIDASKRIPSELAGVIYIGDTTTFPLNDIESMARLHARFYPGFDSTMLHDNLAAFGINANMKLSDMSLGMRRKAMVAYALSLNTRFLLLDEPTNGLDIESKERMQRMMAACVSDDTTVIVSTHTISDLLNLYDAVMVMRAGHLLYTSDTDSIMERVAFVSSFSSVPGSIYSEWVAGQLHSIVPRWLVDNAMSQSNAVDFRLLYTALHSPASKTVLDTLTIQP